ncbi:retrovirus-related pol polyprotein from transposon TNT 1-94 [Tanacetum coccineum]
MAPRTFSTVHVSSPFHQAVKSRGKSQSKVKMDNSEARLQDGRVKMSFKASYWSQKARSHGKREEHKRECLILTLEATHITSTNVSITDCHITPLVQSCQRDPEAPALSLINQDLLYLKKGNSGPEKIVLSLHKFPAIVFNDDDIEERTSRWVNKCIKKFNPYARYGVENWKNPHAKIFYIRRQKEPGRPKEEIYSNSKIVQPDYKNLNKNDIEDMYLLIVNNKVPDYANTGLLWSLSVFIRSSVIWERVHDFQLGIESYQQKINLTAPTITFPGIEEYNVFSIVYEPVHGIIYTNSKKEKRVMRPLEIHSDATLRRTLEGLKSYYNNVKYGYVQKELTNDEVEFLKLFEEEIEKVQKTNVPVIPSTGVNSSTEASGSNPRRNTKNNRILPAKSNNKKKVEDLPRNNKSNLKQENRVDSNISHKRTVVQIILWYLDSGCSKHMTRNRSRLKNFMKKFIWTVRFGNDHFGAITGYGYYVISESVISKVYYVEGLGHNLFFVGQFCDSDLEVAFRKYLCYVRDVDGVELLKVSKNKSWLWHRRLNHLNFGTINDLARKYLSINGKRYILVIVDDYSRFTWVKFLRSKDETLGFVIQFLKQIQFGLNKTVRFIRTDNGTEFVNQVPTEFYESFGITYQKSVLRTPQQNGIVERRNRTLVEAARTMLIFSKALLFLWAAAVATSCYTQNRSLIHTRHNKTPYELVHGKRPDLTFLCVFGALCFPTNDSKDLGKLKAKAYIGIFIGYAPNRKGYRIYNKRTQRIMETIHVQFDELTEQMAPVHITPYVPPTNKDLEILFQPMFDEYLKPLSIERLVPPTPAVQVSVVLASTPSSTIDQDAHSTSHSPSSSEVQALILHQGVAAGPTFEDNPFAQADNDTFENVFAPEPSSEESSSGDVSTAESNQVIQPHDHLRKWTKDHPIDNVIGNL